jgi:hypothetical protein
MRRHWYRVEHQGEATVRCLGLRRVVLMTGGAICLLDPHPPEHLALRSIAGSNKCRCEAVRGAVVQAIRGGKLEALPADLIDAVKSHRTRVRLVRFTNLPVNRAEPRLFPCGKAWRAGRNSFRDYVAELAGEAWRLDLGRANACTYVEGRRVKVVVRWVGCGVFANAKKEGETGHPARLLVTLLPTWASEVLHKGLAVVGDEADQLRRWLVLDAKPWRKGYAVRVVGADAAPIDGNVTRSEAGWTLDVRGRQAVRP